MRYIIRSNCEYSMVVEADSVEAAIAMAEQVDFAEWEQAWAPCEAEPEEVKP